MEENRRRGQCGIFPIRGVIALLIFILLACAMTHRLSFSFCLSSLVIRPNSTNVHNNDVCPINEEEANEHAAHKLGGVFEWSSVMEGFVLASFYIGYTLSHLPAGVVADCYGAKWIMCAAIFVSSLTNVLTPLAIHHGDVFALTVLRIIMGAAQGPVYPAISALLSDWVPREERGTMGAFCFSGVTMGTIFATYSADHLVYEIHWVEAFLIFGCFGFICFLLFVFAVSNSPNNHPCIHSEEKAFLNAQIPQYDISKVPIPWKKILFSKAMFAVIISQIGHDWGYFVMMTCLPKYIETVLQFSINSNGAIMSLPYIVMFIWTNLAGRLADWLVKSKNMEIGYQRRLFNLLGAIGPGGFTVLASYAECTIFWAILLLTMAAFTMGFYYSGQKLSPLDMSPSYSGTIMAICNGLGSFSGIVSPIIVSWMTMNGTLYEWRLVFWLDFFILTSSALVFYKWGSANVQPYDPSYKA